MKKLKKIAKSFFNQFGIDIKRINPEIKNLSFDEILKLKVSKDPLILDVGANKGQTIKRFLDIFSNPTIHAFEPVEEAISKIRDNYSDNKNILINNYALGDKVDFKNFNISQRTENSTFHQFKSNSKWLQTRSKQYHVGVDDYVKKVQKIKIETIDNYVAKNKIEEIDILKMDTEGYEDKVLSGAINTLKQNKIKIVLTELAFDDVRDKHLSFSDIEQYLLPNNFRLVGIDLANNNLFSGLVFFADVMYFNKNFYDI
jgi:FkbM family methyltransferase|tara:strand:+ start:17 stop:787 length:771 start_codon:yes stop_codon:yes gene_type:complete